MELQNVVLTESNCLPQVQLLARHIIRSGVYTYFTNRSSEAASALFRVRAVKLGG